MSQALLQLNLARSEIATGKDLRNVWNQIINSLPNLSTNLSEWFLNVYSLLTQDHWKYDKDQALFFQAFESGQCNCACGVQLLLCIAENKQLLGKTIGEIKWENHTTLALRTSSSGILSLETTNKNPHWKSIRETKRCHYKTIFDKQLLFLSSMTEIVRKDPKRLKIIEAVFRKFPSSFWQSNGGDIGWICWRWTTASGTWKAKAWPLVKQVLNAKAKELGDVLHKRICLLLFLTTPSGTRASIDLKTRIRGLNTSLKTTCPRVK